MSVKTIVPKSQEPASLDSLIRRALEESANSDPYAAVDAVVNSMPADLRDHYLRQAVRARIQPVLSLMRTHATPTIRKGVSTKQSLIRDEYWPRFLRQRIFLPDGHKFLAEATSDDLRAVAAQREAQAQELLFRSEQFTALAELMDQAQVKHLEQLDQSAGMRVMERAA